MRDAPATSRRSLAAAAELLPALLPGALAAYFAFNSGGYFAAAVALVAVELCVLIALRFGVARVPWEGLSLPLVLAAAALAGFAGWTLASQGWSHAPFRAAVEYDRALLYLLALVFFGSFSFSVLRVRWMLYGLAAAIVVVCGVAFTARTLPEVILHVAPVQPERLSYPLSYWNSLGLFAAIGLVLCGHLACSTRDPWPARVLGAASVPLLASVLYYTFSRGGTWVALGAVALYVVIGRPRALISGALATAPAALVALTTVNPADAILDNPLGPDAIAAGNRVALTVALCVVGAGASRALLLPLDARLDRFKLPDHLRRRALAFGAAAAMAVLLAGCAALQVPSVVGDKYEEFTSDDDVARNGSSRLLDASSNGRSEHWDVALAAYRAEPGHGTGAGTWALEWNRERDGGGIAQDTHSLYLEVLAELGLPGLLLLGSALLLILGAFAWRARGPDRALFAALLAAAVAWAIHAGIDWDWEMPAVTLWLFALGGAALARRSRAEGSSAARRWTIPARVAVIAACVAVAILPARVALSETHFENSVDALNVRDCRTALPEARDALAQVGERAAPYQAIAYCERLGGNWDGAVRAMDSAVQRDPGDWKLWRGLAVARASAGLDPRPQARKALSLNPNEPLAQDAATRFATRRPRAWVHRGRTAAFAPPEIGHF